MSNEFSLEDLRSGLRTPTVADLLRLKSELEDFKQLGIILREQEFWLEQMDTLIAIAMKEETAKEQLAGAKAKQSPKTLRFPCPACGRFIKTRMANVGKQAQCPGCQQELVVPSVTSGEKEVPAGSGAGVTDSDYRAFIQRAEELLPRLANAVDIILQRVYADRNAGLSGSLQLHRDLAFLAVSVTEADGDFTDSELLMVSDVVSLLCGTARTLFLDSQAVERHAVKQHIPEFIANLQTPDVTLFPGWAWSLDSKCMSVQYLAQYDIWNGTNYAKDFVAFTTEYCDLLTKADAIVSEEEETQKQRLREWILRSYNEMQDDNTDAEPTNGIKTSKAPDLSLGELLTDLHALTGLSTVKQEVDDLVAFLKVQGIRKDRGMAPASISRHLVFYGNPGTGKTTVARLLSKIYASLGFLSKGHLVETDRSGMVAGFVGQTALKTREVCDKALGGILFIDEAYTLVGRDNDYGQEAVDTLLKFMEDNRDNLVVVVAGYPDKMSGFLDSNPGIRSRFTRFMNFEDYSPNELSSIFTGFCKEGGFMLSQEAHGKAKSIFDKQYLNRDENFGNARFARNLFEQCLVRHARRITRADDITDGMLTTLEEDDVEWVG